MMDKRTKIVATTGPVSENPETIQALVEAGVDVFRLNFSHKSHDEADRAIAMIHDVRKKLRKPVAIMADIKGPALRLYGYSEKIQITRGQELIIQSHDPIGIESSKSDEAGTVFTNLPNIDRICAIGQKIILMDGYFTGKVVGREKTVSR